MLAGHFDPDRARHAPASAVVIEASEGAAAARSGSVHCVFEGHVFHDAGLARELHHQVDSDAELVARAYARHGVRMLDGIRGSFAFVAWDEETGRGIVAQDQIGTRTIYLATDGSRLVFASEVIDLLRCLPRRPAPDGHSISHLLFGGGQLPDRSLYEGVRPLRGAHVVEMGPDGWHARRYWEPSFEGTLDLPRPELAEQLREKVEQSVRRRIENHTPGILLSGGLDSSVVASLAAPIAADDSPLRTYSCVFPGEPDYDESARIESLTSTLPVIGNHFLLEPQGSFSLSLRHLERWGFPGLAPGSLVETPPLAYAAADGVDVMLDGQGGDEVFGVSAYLMADRLASGRLMSAVRLARSYPGLNHRASWREAADLLKYFGVKGAFPHSVGERIRRRHEPEAVGPDILNPTYKRLFVEADDPWHWKLSGDGPRWWRSLKYSLVDEPHFEGRHEHWRQQRGGFGIEARSPLYDIDLIEYTLRIPPQIAFDPHTTRPLIREAMRGRMPESVRTHSKKAHFATFNHGIISGRDFPPIKRLLEAPDAEILAYVDPKRLRTWLDWNPPTVMAKASWTLVVWCLSRAESWLRWEQDRSFPERLLASGEVPEPVCTPAPAAAVT